MNVLFLKINMLVDRDDDNNDRNDRDINNIDNDCATNDTRNSNNIIDNVRGINDSGRNTSYVM